MPLLHLYTYFASWYWKRSQLPRAAEVMDCRIKSPTTTLLDSEIAHYILNLILTSTDKCICIPHQRSFSSQQLETSTENHNWTQCRGQQTHRAPSSNRHSYITAPELQLREHYGRKILRVGITRKSAVKQSLFDIAGKHGRNSSNISRQVNGKEEKL